MYVYTMVYTLWKHAIKIIITMIMIMIIMINELLVNHITSEQKHCHWRQAIYYLIFYMVLLAPKQAEIEENYQSIDHRVIVV